MLRFVVLNNIIEYIYKVCLIFINYRCGLYYIFITTIVYEFINKCILAERPKPSDIYSIPGIYFSLQLQPLEICIIDSVHWSKSTYRNIKNTAIHF